MCALKDYANRDEIVIATKVYFRMHEGPNGAGLYDSIRFTDGITILPSETMEELHDVASASSMHPWQFLKALHVAEKMDGLGL